MSRLELFQPRTPSRMRRVLDAVRSYALGPLSLKDPEIRKYFSGGETSTGVSISEYSALNYSAVWSAVKLISSDVAGLPLVLYRRDGDKKQKYDGHPLYRILHDSPNPEMSSFTFRQTLQAHCLTWGNGYAEIERDGTGRPKYLWPLTPDRVAPMRESSGRLAYRVLNDNGNGSKEVILNADDVLHVPGLGWDGVQGYGVISKARESVSLGVAAERFAGTFYGNGSTFGGTITHPTRFSTPLARTNFEKSLRDRHRGVDRAHGLLLLEEGMTYAQMGIPPDQAQFLESRQFQITEIARWFNVPPHKIGDLSRATFSNIEQQNLEYLQTTLIHWLETWEQELMRKLISPLERNQQFIEHVVEGFKRGDSQGRAALQTAEFQIGALTPNESRSLSNRNPVDGGDRPFVPMNMIPLDRVDDWIDAQIEGKKAKAQPPAAPAARSDDADAAALREAVAELRAALASERDVRSQLLSEKGAVAQRADDLSCALAQMEERAEQAEANYSQALENLDGARVAVVSEQAERAREKAAAETALEAERAKTDRNAEVADEYFRKYEIEKAALKERIEQVDRLAGDLSQASFELDKTKEESLGWFTAASDAKTAKQEAEAAAMQAQAEREAAIQRAEQAERDKAITEKALEAAQQVIESVRAEHQQTKDEHAARVSGILVAHRALIVDVTRRMLERESDKARSHRLNKQKLTSWIDTFYETRAEAVAEALLPSVRAYLSVLASPEDPIDMARQLADEHTAVSVKQLRDVLQAEDFGPSLDRMLAKWETARPEQTADRLLTKGLSDVR